MICKQLSLNEQQIGSFDRFLLNGTGRVLNALESMCEFDIDWSDSNIELGPANGSEGLKRAGKNTLYTFSSSLLGEMRGCIQLMMRSVDYDYIGELMQPVLSLIFLSKPESDLETLESRKPGWMEDSELLNPEDAEHHQHIIDAMAELSNVLIGVYTKAIYEMCALNTHHSMPELSQDSTQRYFNGEVTSSGRPEQLAGVIENEIHVGKGLFFLWCVITFTEESLQILLDQIKDCHHYR